jgi:hypothetical protein
MMKYFSHSRRFSRKSAEALPDSPAQPAELPPVDAPALPLLKTVSWGAATLGVLALGVVVGREIRLRYKFNRRTPYDLYAHSGDNHDVDFGIGI